MCVSRSFSQYGVLGICTFDTFYHGYFPGAGLPFLFSFGCIPFYITFHSQKSTTHAFARREGFLPAFLPASCFPLQPEQTPAGCFAQSGCRTSGHDPPRRAFWPAIGSFLPLQCQGCGWPADFMPALRGECACLCLADTSFRSPSLHVLLFHYCFWAKSQSFSAAKIVCGRERLDKP